jgi:hypothetical protein
VRWAQIVAAIDAGATGVFLIVSPTLFVSLVFGSDLSEPGRVIGHLGGLALVSLVIACWPTTNVPTAAALQALLFYNLVATGYLVHLGIAGKLVGELLWAEAALHTVLTILLAVAWFTQTPKRDVYAAKRGGQM